MDVHVAISLGQQMLAVALTLAGPILGTGLLVGVVVAVMQTITSIQEQTLSLVPKMLAVACVVFFLMPWIFRVLTAFARPLFENLARFAA